MADEKRFSVEEAAKELRTGVSTLLLWQHLYSEFLARPDAEGAQILSREDIRLFTYVSECTESGLTREEIRQALRNRASGQGPLFSRTAFSKNDDDDILSLLDEENPTPALLARLVIQQRRLADAQERKAIALERRLTIEEEKARTLADLLATLKNSGLPLAPWPASGTPPLAQPTPEPAPPVPTATDPPAETPPVAFAPPSDAPPAEEPLDHPSAPVGEPPSEDPLDDLHALLDEPTTPEPLDNLSALLPEPPAEEPLDDLWRLVGDDTSQAADTGDNLWDLVDTPAGKADQDDLWALVDDAKGPARNEAQDDLWKLVDQPPSPQQGKKPMSDTGLDDLWASTEPPAAPPPKAAQQTAAPQETDNLWKLVDAEPAPAVQRPDVVRPAPPQRKKAAPLYPTEPAAYKDYILKEIIGMKRREGLSAAQVAGRLNNEEKPTFSGKGAWEARTIEGIFRIIEKAGPR